MHSPLLAPVVVLVAWTMVMWTWMYLTRIPAIQQAKMRLNRYAPRGEQMNELPPQVRWKADNYNHLMEQPTVFYAIVLALVLMDQSTTANVALAWAYTGLRVVHSIIQATWNKILVRFAVFSVSSLALIGLTVNAIIAVF